MTRERTQVGQLGAADRAAFQVLVSSDARRERQFIVKIRRKRWL
jgi:hypothetical protein